MQKEIPSHSLFELAILPDENIRRQAFTFKAEITLFKHKCEVESVFPISQHYKSEDHRENKGSFIISVHSNRLRDT